MSAYSRDRKFTDYIHKNIAIPQIYTPLNWQQVPLDEIVAEHIDIVNGLDYLFRHKGVIKTVQERFRERKYQRYADFTIRLRRDSNKHADRKKSEYYKMKASYFTYGITNCFKEDFSKCTDFIKYVIIDLERVYAKIDKNEIIIRDNGRSTCRLLNGKVIECPVKYNRDGSSSFFPIDIALLVELWGKDMIVAQKGFV